MTTILAWWQPLWHDDNHYGKMTTLMAWWHPLRYDDNHANVETSMYINSVFKQPCLHDDNHASMMKNMPVQWKPCQNDDNHAKMIPTMPSWWQQCWQDDKQADMLRTVENLTTGRQPCWHYKPSCFNANPSNIMTTMLTNRLIKQIISVLISHKNLKWTNSHS